MIKIQQHSSLTGTNYANIPCEIFRRSLCNTKGKETLYPWNMFNVWVHSSRQHAVPALKSASHMPHREVNHEQQQFSPTTEMLSVIFMVKPCINNIQHFNFQLMHTTLKNVELLEHFKISKNVPTCFGLQGNHRQGATIST